MPATASLDPDDRLDEAVLLILKAADSGIALDAATLRRQFPELSTQLERFLDDESHLAALLTPLQSISGPPAAKGPPREFGKYILHEEIGRGGMGVVYKADQRGRGRAVALKLVRMGALASEAEIQRFRNEAEAISELSHPHIVAVYDVGEYDGQLYYTMPLLEGGSLIRSLPRLKNEPREAATLVAAVARGVHHAHQRGVLHRDIKPSNVLLDSDGRPYIADFGLAKRVDAEESLTETGAVVGTPAFMSPEQALGRTSEITIASDVYSLGAILYATLAGKPPFAGSTLLETLIQVRQSEPESLIAHNPLVDRDLSAICLKCLEKDALCRYHSAEALAEDLDRWLAGIPVQARAAGRVGRTWRWCRRNPLVAALSTATLLQTTRKIRTNLRSPASFPGRGQTPADPEAGPARGTAAGSSSPGEQGARDLRHPRGYGCASRALRAA